MFIVIDSIDGGGSETQSTLVAKKLTEAGKKVTILRYPNYENEAGKMIRSFLYENKHLPVEKQFLFYTLQFVFDADKIQKLSESEYVIADRYFTTTLVFQILGGFSEKTALQFAHDFGIIKPAKIFFLDVTPEVAIKWKQGEDKEKNFWEKDLGFMKKTYKQFLDLADRDVWASWEKIQGERSKEEVANDIVNKINNL